MCYGHNMADEGFLLAKGDDDLNYYEERARQEWVDAESAIKPEAASAYRVLAIEY